eukprot:GHVQ01015971.1.p1 GENE.GHVQ01015971.1~~GHVQ01015971.1.p1  ORF type:complete len:249 (-),score=46.40 GHVQ01015971.1:59-805(-)
MSHGTTQKGCCRTLPSPIWVGPDVILALSNITQLPLNALPRQSVPQHNLRNPSSSSQTPPHLLQQRSSSSSSCSTPQTCDANSPGRIPESSRRTWRNGGSQQRSWQRGSYENAAGGSPEPCGSTVADWLDRVRDGESAADLFEKLPKPATKDHSDAPSGATVILQQQIAAACVAEGTSKLLLSQGQSESEECLNLLRLADRHTRSHKTTSQSSVVSCTVRASLLCTLGTLHKQQVSAACVNKHTNSLV